MSAVPPAPLVIARRLAVRLMHEAQLSPEAPIEGLIGARGEEPRSVYPLAAGETHEAVLSRLRGRGETLWACYRSHPGAPAQPEAGDRARVPEGALLLIATLVTKGVLELRCWDVTSATPCERELKIKD